ncbi:predicted protein [Pyrenophora tritici-repentis Pt-1C-BFP]|uniref:Uncharacterized protein n=1 Tax=Pyrenophora tritici-repentis (strain Pt-1C-BFP) TaxID=426418 RepID=B2W433_PYRTR|nr:uncharacterized protein PTRG_05233 [Pyrenophora tritici-repentis Pt-1C-BFP]EDU48140.1 predicted protein [Pyrenophora tritici-repentis Pt-1C-BFP]
MDTASLYQPYRGSNSVSSAYCVWELAVHVKHVEVFSFVHPVSFDGRNVSDILELAGGLNVSAVKPGAWV